MRDERTIAIRLVSAAATSVSRVRSARVQLDLGIPRAQIVISDAPPFLRDGIVRIAAGRRREVLDGLLISVEETDRGMKSGGPQGRIAVARLAARAGIAK